MKTINAFLLGVAVASLLTLISTTPPERAAANLLEWAKVFHWKQS